MNKIYNFLFITACIIITLIAVFFCGYYYGGKSVPPGVIYRDKIVTQTIYRDYPSMSKSDCLDKLMCYDTKQPTLDIQHIDENRYTLSAGLCERKWNRDVEIELARSGAWRYYIAGGVCAGVVAAYLLMK